jgi:hypothetical protein
MRAGNLCTFTSHPDTAHPERETPPPRVNRDGGVLIIRSLKSGVLHQ